MTTFELASLSAQETALWVGVALVVVTFVIGVGQIAVVAIGIRAMQKAGDRRAREQDQRHAEAMTALREQAQRHDETMTALRELIERTAPPAGTATP